MRGLLGLVRFLGTGDLSQNVSGTKKNSRVPQKPTTIATILETHQYGLPGIFG